MVRVVGIDPGLSGGVASAQISADGSGYTDYDAKPLPLIGKLDRDLLGFGLVDTYSLSSMLREWNPDFVLVEHVGTDTKFAPKNAWTFGVGFGALIGCIASSFDDGVKRMILVRPKKWQETFGRGKDKDRSISDARTFFPGVEFKGDGPAEALLLIEHYRRVIMTSPFVETL